MLAGSAATRCNHAMLRTLAIVLLLTCLTACAQQATRNPLAQWQPSPNHDLRRPSLIVLHATGQDSVRESLATLRGSNDSGRVSAHYLIARDGHLYQLVADQHRAWHAGAGYWAGSTDINSISIGIELDNNGDEPFPEPQIQRLLVLLDDLCRRWRIDRTRVVAHADVAPTRKVDPGLWFPWQTLADHGFGLWPDASVLAAPEPFDVEAALARLGYSLADPNAALRAFRLRFRGLDFEGEADAEDRRILYALTRATNR